MEKYAIFVSINRMMQLYRSLNCLLEEYFSYGYF